MSIGVKQAASNAVRAGQRWHLPVDTLHANAFLSITYMLCFAHFEQDIAQEVSHQPSEVLKDMPYRMCDLMPLSR